MKGTALSYSLDTSHDSPAVTRGREGHAIEGITIHHWGADGQTHDGVVSYLCRPGATTSAHYVASAGRVSCIVDPDDTAWHAGDWDANLRQIGIECRPEMSEGDIATVAELIHDLRATYGPLPLAPHSRWTATACPGRWAAQLDALSRRADGLTGGGAAPTPTPTPARPQIDEDGLWGADTTGRLQQIAGTPADRAVSSQSSAWRASLAGCTTGWQFVAPAQAEGSQLIAWMQRQMGITADGLAGLEFIAALERRHGYAPEAAPRLDSPSNTIRAMQHSLNTEGMF
jgi:hypothetical protein